MRVYVASKFERKAEVQAAYAALRQAGHEVTLDWTVHSAAGLHGRALVDKLAREAAADVEGVQRADALLLLHDDNCRGAFWEAGMAAALGKLVLVVGGRSRGHAFPIFYFHPAVHHFDTLDAALTWLHWTETTFSDVDGCASCRLLRDAGKVGRCTACEMKAIQKGAKP